jgi:isocitrate/isopropylmalate dehydrogenase
MSAVETVTGRREVLTPDLGGDATTDAVTRAVCDALAGVNRPT